MDVPFMSAKFFVLARQTPQSNWLIANQELNEATVMNELMDITARSADITFIYTQAGTQTKCAARPISVMMCDAPQAELIMQKSVVGISAREDVEWVGQVVCRRGGGTGAGSGGADGWLVGATGCHPWGSPAESSYICSGWGVMAPPSLTGNQADTVP